MAVLCVQRNLSAQLILHSTTVAFASPLCLELLVFCVDPVRLLVLPIVIVASSGLELIAGVSVDLF
jgi:hypothetical protein